MIKIIISLILITASFNCLSQDFKILNAQNSLAFNLLEKKYNKEEFVRENHKTYNNIRLRERDKILSIPIEEICYKIYYGQDLFKKNKSEGEFCLSILINQGHYEGAKYLSKIKLEKKLFSKIHQSKWNLTNSITTKFSLNKQQVNFQDFKNKNKYDLIFF